MTNAEARGAREAVGLTRDQLAYQMNVTESAVAAWEDGRMRVPKHVAADLAWRVAAHERQAAIHAAGLPACDWIRELEARAVPTDVRGEAERIRRLLIHARSCDVCAAREAFIAQRCPPMPPAPRHGWDIVIGPIAQRIDALPPWARAPVSVVLLFIAISLVKLLLALPTWTSRGVAGALDAIEPAAGGALIAIVLGSLFVAATRRRDARMSPEQRAALELLEEQKADLLAYDLAGGAVQDAYLRQRYALRRGDATVADLRSSLLSCERTHPAVPSGD